MTELPDSTALSYQQQGIWLIDQMYPGTTAYNVPLGYEFVGSLDPQSLHSALSAFVARHEAPRSVLAIVGSQIRQRVQPPALLDLPVVDLSGATDPMPRARAYAEELAQRPFDLDTGPLLRASLLRLAPDRHRLLITIHHIAFDGWSAALLGAEVSAGYKATLGGRHHRLDPPTQYREYCEWQREQLAGARFDQLRTYWESALTGIEDFPPLPTDNARPVEMSFDGNQLTHPVSPAATGALERLARGLRTTPFVVLLCVYALVLVRQTGGDRIPVGTPAANRAEPTFHSTVGMLTNVLVLPMLLRHDMSFEDLILATHHSVRQAMGHQEMPLGLLASELCPKRDPSRNPLFDAAFSYRRSDIQTWQLPGCQTTAVHTTSGVTKFDLTLSIVHEPHTMEARWDYRTALFEEGTIMQIAGQFESALQTVVTEPWRKIRSVPAERIIGRGSSCLL